MLKCFFLSQCWVNCTEKTDTVNAVYLFIYVKICLTCCVGKWFGNINKARAGTHVCSAEWRHQEISVLFFILWCAITFQSHSARYFHNPYASWRGLGISTVVLLFINWTKKNTLKLRTVWYSRSCLALNKSKTSIGSHSNFRIFVWRRPLKG